MQAKTPPSSDTAKPSEQQPEQEMKTPPGPYVGRPLDGSQYIDVVEEQEYADRPPTREEQQPRYSYLKEEQHPKQ
ncbi:hypothetical protein RY831_31590 [Noviherbaspirillum sp. CPCC 100848]|uniref:Uncharacterized protein n=1 Tax=Noviherbaspirillum album TaxID=3080276 RepID=A0ABU6JJ06_9BURK|nr:hypothetical protein [Noviherbaspirillum sp. CPCC 100848]MEC4723669.1 hypothetical protein [Noviherbaspirillum sp. CPCC 100848]